jgi:hypothetical protein
LGIRACLAGHRVAFRTATEWDLRDRVTIEGARLSDRRNCSAPRSRRRIGKRKVESVTTRDIERLACQGHLFLPNGGHRMSATGTLAPSLQELEAMIETILRSRRRCDVEPVPRLVSLASASKGNVSSPTCSAVAGGPST